MGAITATRWTKYGKDRLYLTRGGVKLGWYDLLDGRLHLEVESARTEVEQFLLATGHATVPVAGEREPTPAPGQTGLGGTEWDDLAENRPGEAARARAAQERAAQREHSRVGSWLARALDLKTDERAWRVGADGEETIGAKLDKLTEHGWRVLHSVPVGRGSSDIDHVLIGPGGVYTVNTKKHPNARVWIGGDTVMVNGHRQPYVRNSRHEAQRASRLLTAKVGFEVGVRGVLVFTTATLFPDVTVKKAPDDVIVLDRMDVPRVFRRATTRLGSEQIDAIYEAARRSTTWRT
jgi:hypothetical protein